MTCWCWCCDEHERAMGRLAILAERMNVCATCGFKRCPRATSHHYPCTHSNEPGQNGSRYA